MYVYTCVFVIQSIFYLHIITVHLSSNKCVRELNTKGGDGEMVQLLRAVVAHAEDLSWMPSST